MRFVLPKIYPITDRALSGLSHSEQVRRLIDGGASLIQLRDKTASPVDFYNAAVEAVTLAQSFGVSLIINDRVDIALAAGADGVHLGQDDLPPQHARKILGPDAIIGFSTHSVEQARAAIALPVDYIAIGPIFSTTTKTDAEPVIGLDGLREARSVVGDRPLVAIGGINRTNVGSVLEAGANSAALIAGIVSEPDKITTRMRELFERQHNDKHR